MNRSIALVSTVDLTALGGVIGDVLTLDHHLRGRGREVGLLNVPFARIRLRIPGFVRRVFRRVDRSSEESLRICAAIRRLSAMLALRPAGEACIAFDAWASIACLRAGRSSIVRLSGYGWAADEWVSNGWISAWSPWRRVLRSWERRAVAEARGVVVLSSASRGDAVSRGIEAGKIRVIPNGLSRPEWLELERAPTRTVGRLTVASVGNLRPVKGLDILADALRRMSPEVRGRVRLLVVGSGNDASNPHFCDSRDRLHEAGIEAEFTGPRPHEEIGSLLAHADLYVQPSRQETFGVAVLEAMAVGAPVIASSVGAVPELLEGGRAGVLVPPGESAPLAAAIERLVGDPGLRKRLGRAARERVRSEYSVDRMIDGHMEVIAGALEPV